MIFRHRVKIQSFLAVCFLFSSPFIGAIGEEYQINRLNGNVMKSTGDSKKITVSMMDLAKPVYVFFDYNYSAVPLSQRVELTPEAHSAAVTLMPGSKTISVAVVPVSAVHEFLSFMSEFSVHPGSDKGVEFTYPNDKKSLFMLAEHRDQLYSAGKSIANIMYEKISDGENIVLPNLFEKAPAPVVVTPVERTVMHEDFHHKSVPIAEHEESPIVEYTQSPIAEHEESPEHDEMAE